MLISPAYAQAAAPGGASDLISMLLPFVLIFVVFYFLLIRPQQKRMKEHADMVANLRRGDQVVTGGGIIGTVAKVPNDDSEVMVEIAQGVQIRVARSTISNVLSKPVPAKDEKAEKKDKAKENKPDSDADQPKS